MLIHEFRSFLTKTNTLSFALGVIIGAATGKLVSAIVDDLFMPLIALVLPPGDWREAQIILSQSHDVGGKMAVNAVKYGHLFGSALDFVIISFVVFFMTKLFLKNGMSPPTVPTRVCPECLETIPATAKKCRACTSTLATN